eukprot:gene54872-75179_t
MFNPEIPVYYRHPHYVAATGERRSVIDPATLATVGTIAGATLAEREAALDAVTDAQRHWK